MYSPRLKAPSSSLTFSRSSLPPFSFASSRGFSVGSFGLPRLTADALTAPPLLLRVRVLPRFDFVPCSFRCPHFAPPSSAPLRPPLRYVLPRLRSLGAPLAHPLSFVPLRSTALASVCLRLPPRFKRSADF